MMTTRRMSEMKRGKDALLHRIGENDSYGVDQLPDPARLTPFKAIGDLQEDPSRLGAALAESFFKLLRPEPETRMDIDGSGGDLYAYLQKMDAPEMRLGFLCHIEALLQLALIYPERLPIFIARLDSLDNVALNEQATKALCYEPVSEHRRGFPLFFGDLGGGLFDGLTDGDL
jgi:hypothetical protein